MPVTGKKKLSHIQHEKELKRERRGEATDMGAGVQDKTAPVAPARCLEPEVLKIHLGTLTRPLYNNAAVL